ncbi:lipopolysaccharide biosynthesis protein [Wohlfahrtiimonas chitiniclastica]|uniref:lipopolysaccharide biosynthesis protein n=1 Tax=Wohlfahrtiimonas chitiniclastica TaxID=400946 RepID=UPI00036E9E58|nr:oligosaccharide flippase family protein [Wohlfahrtiimonas chitiniclastica]
MLKKFLIYAIGPITNGIFALITLPVLTWYFSQEDIGKFSLLQTLLSLGVLLFSLDLHQAYVRHYYDIQDKGRLFRQSFYPSFIFSILIICVIWGIDSLLSYQLIGWFFHLPDNGLYLYTLISLTIICLVFINFLSHQLRMSEKVIAYSVTQALSKGMLLIFVLFGISLFEVLDFKILVLLNTVVTILLVLIFLLISRKNLYTNFIGDISIKELKILFKFSLPLILGSAAYWGLLSLDRLFLNYYSTLSEIALYSISVTVASSLFLVVSIFSTIWHPTLYKWIHNGVDNKKIFCVISNTACLAFILWSLFGMLSWVVPLILPIGYEGIDLLIVSAIALPLFYLMSETTMVGISITKKTIYITISSVCALFINSILNFYWIPKYGAIGATLASAASFFLLFIIRTEASSFLWNRLPRIRIYILSGIYLSYTVFLLFNEIDIYIRCIVWMILLIFSIFVFREDLLKVKEVFNRC